jgi:hypothetical protein
VDVDGGVGNFPSSFMTSPVIRSLGLTTGANFRLVRVRREAQSRAHGKHCSSINELSTFLDLDELVT